MWQATATATRRAGEKAARGMRRAAVGAARERSSVAGAGDGGQAGVQWQEQQSEGGGVAECAGGGVELPPRSPTFALYCEAEQPPSGRPGAAGWTGPAGWVGPAHLCGLPAYLCGLPAHLCGLPAHVRTAL
eukprot:165806-Chlamydomonas_euryale.AAC.1